MSEQQNFDLTRAVSSPFTGREFFVFGLINLLLSQLSGLLGKLMDVTLLNYFSVVGILGLMGGFWYLSRRREKEKRQQLQIVTFQPHRDDRPAKARGMILLISPFDPRDRDLAKSTTFKEALTKVLEREADQLTDGDFNAINFLNSNLAPQVKAVEYHMQQDGLKELWLIATRSVTDTGGNVAKGSEEAATILTNYLKKVFPSLIVHPPAEVNDWDYKGIWEAVETIYRTADYKDELLIADITGGNKIMSVAAALACIPPKRRLQYIYSQRDSFGNPLPAGKIDPILIDVDPILYNVQKTP